MHREEKVGELGRGKGEKLERRKVGRRKIGRRKTGRKEAVFCTVVVEGRRGWVTRWREAMHAQQVIRLLGHRRLVSLHSLAAALLVGWAAGRCDLAMEIDRDET